MREKLGLTAATTAAKVMKNNASPGGVFKDHPQVVQKIISCQGGMRDARQEIDGSVIRSVIQGIIQSDAPELFAKVVARPKGS